MSESRQAFVFKALLEMVFVALGVFLAMAADQWRTDRQHEEGARAALQRFKTEIEANKAAVEKVMDYHVQTRKAIIAYLNPKLRDTTSLKLNGLQPVNFEHTAWDLAIATQALADVDPAIAFELTRIYAQQQMTAGLTAGLMQAMYLRPPTEQLIPFLHSVKVYYDDLMFQEPALLESYARVLPLIDRALKD